MLDFNTHRYQLQILDDFSPTQVFYKAAQGPGLTTVMIIKQLHQVRYRGLESIYTMPSDSDVYTIVKSKVNRIIEANPDLFQWTADHDSIEMKRVGKNQIYYRGTFTEKQALSIASDWNIFDEEDRSKQSIIELYSSRQQASKFAWNYHISNPSVEGAGVSKYWPLSTQNHWFIRCAKCSRDQFMSWPESFDLDKKEYVCKFCRALIPDQARIDGWWKPKQPNMAISGYWLPLWISPFIPASRVIEDFTSKSRQFFWNFVQGLPYVGEGNKLSPADVFKNCTADVAPLTDVVIGVDVGVTRHVVIGTPNGLFWYGKFEDENQIEQLLKKYPGSIMVIDMGPDITWPRRLAEKYPGRVWLCHFVQDKKGQNWVKWREKHVVWADRNKMIQDIVDAFIEGRIPIFGKKHDWQEFYDHWSVLYRVTGKDNNGNVINEWLSSTDTDHFALATVYWRVGVDRRLKSQTFTAGGDVATLEQLGVEEGIHINPDKTAPLPHPDKVFQTITPPEDWEGEPVDIGEDYD